MLLQTTSMTPRASRWSSNLPSRSSLMRGCRLRRARMSCSRDGAKTVGAVPGTLVGMPLASSVVQIPPGVLAAGYCLSISEFWTDGSILPPRRQVINPRPRRSSGRLRNNMCAERTPDIVCADLKSVKRGPVARAVVASAGPHGTQFSPQQERAVASPSALLKRQTLYSLPRRCRILAKKKSSARSDPKRTLAELSTLHQRALIQAFAAREYDRP